MNQIESVQKRVMRKIFYFACNMPHTIALFIAGTADLTKRQNYFCAISLTLSSSHLFVYISFFCTAAVSAHFCHFGPLHIYNLTYLSNVTQLCLCENTWWRWWYCLLPHPINTEIISHFSDLSKFPMIASRTKNLSIFLQYFVEQSSLFVWVTIMHRYCCFCACNAVCILLSYLATNSIKRI